MTREEAYEHVERTSYLVDLNAEEPTMSQMQQYQTQQQWREWLANGKEVTTLMQIERCRQCPGDGIEIDYAEEICVTGKVEFNPETDAYWVIGLYPSDQNGDEVDLDDEERAQAVALLIKKYFEEVGL